MAFYLLVSRTYKPKRSGLHTADGKIDPVERGEIAAEIKPHNGVRDTSGISGPAGIFMQAVVRQALERPAHPRFR